MTHLTQKTVWIPSALVAGAALALGLSGSPWPVQAQDSVWVAQAEEAETLPVVLSISSYLTDIAQAVAGDRLEIMTLIPLGVDPHGFEPTPADVRKVADSEVLIVNGGGFEEFLEDLLANAGGERVVISASEGLDMRIPGEAEPIHSHSHDEHGHDEHGHDEGHDHSHSHEQHSHDEHSHDEGHEDDQAGDPHFWTDPTQVISYVDTIRDGLIEVDPAGEAIYAANAEAYKAELMELDADIQELVAAIPAEDRLLVTDHDSLGYFADRYGFRVVGTVIPSFSTGVSPSAQALAQLTDTIQETGARAIFSDVANDTQIAEQLAADVGIPFIALYTHSLTEPGGNAPTYIEMMRYNARAIVAALE